MSLERRLLKIILTFATIISLGGIGYAALEGWSLVDALYMAVITVTTVGFGEVHPLTSTGKLFTSILILLGVGGITYAFTELTNYMIAGELGDVLEAMRMRRKIESLQNHYIVCGYGRVGQKVCAELAREEHSMVLIDISEKMAAKARTDGYLVVQGDAGEDQTLIDAGIERALGLVAAVNSDAANLYVVLSSRSLNPNLTIVTRADSEDTIPKLQRAGADRVIAPYSLGGHRMAHMLLRPDVVDFLELVMQDESLELFLEDVRVGPGCILEQCTVKSAQIRQTTGANLLAIKSESGLIVSPELDTRLHSGDVLMALGTRQQLAALADLLRSPAH